MVKKLQENLYQSEAERRKLTEEALSDRQKYEKKMQEKLEARSAQMKDKLNAILAKAMEDARKDVLKNLLPADALELLENNSTLISKMQEKLDEHEAALLDKVASKNQENSQSVRVENNEQGIRDFLLSNDIAMAILKSNVNRRLEVEKAKATAKISAEFEQKLKDTKEAMEKEAEKNKARAILLKEKTFALILSQKEEHLCQAEGKLRVIETAVTARPNTTIAQIWSEMNQNRAHDTEPVALESALAGMGTPDVQIHLGRQQNGMGHAQLPTLPL